MRLKITHRVVLMMVGVWMATSAQAHIMQKSYVETTKAGIQKLYIRIKESKKHPGYFNFQLCQFKYKDQTTYELDMERNCNDLTQGEMAISAFPNRPEPDALGAYDQSAYEHYFKIASMVPYNATSKKSGALGVDDRRSSMENFATIMAAFSLGEFAVFKMGIKSFILAIGVDVATFFAIDEMKAHWSVNEYLGKHASADPAYRNLSMEPKNRKWDGFFGTKYWPTIELTTLAVMTGKNEQGYPTPFLLGACTKEDLDEKFEQSRFAGDCTTIQEAALILEIALQEFAYHQSQMTFMNSRVGPTTSTPLDVFDPSLTPWHEDFNNVADPASFDDCRSRTAYRLDKKGQTVRYKNQQGQWVPAMEVVSEKYFSYVEPKMKTPADDYIRWGEDLLKWWKGLWED